MTGAPEQEAARACPYCGYEVNSAWAEIRHMERYHPRVIDERMIAAGFGFEDGKWIDLRVGDD